LRACRPGGVAADVVAGAIGTSGAISTAPFRRRFICLRQWQSWRLRPIPVWRQLRGPKRLRGTWFKGEDGRRHLCQ